MNIKSLKEDYAYIFNHAEVTHCFLSDKELYAKAIAVKEQVPTLKEIYAFDVVKGCKNWEEVLDLGKDETLQADVEKIKDQVKSDDLATIIYTSGTTGKPKGVMLSHKNVVTNVIDCMPRLPLELGNFTALSFLPVCHIFERMLIYLYQYSGTTIYYAEGLDKIGENLKEVNPELMSVVPRLLEKLFDKIYVKGDELSGLKRALFYWAVSLAELYEPYGANGWWYEFKLKIARKLIFSKWQEALGGNLTTMVSGSAALQPKLSRVFCAAGMYVMEGYGLTETAAPSHTNPPDAPKKQCLGIPFMSVDARVVDPETLKELPQGESGEIVISGPQVFKGYWKRPDATASAFFERDGKSFFRSGDMGRIDEEGYFLMTDRLKRMINASGFKVWPAEVEALMFKHPAIQEACIISTKDAYRGESVKAVVVLRSTHKGQVSEQDIIDWCRETMAVYKMPRVVEFIDALPKSGSGKVMWRALQEAEMAKTE